VAFQFDLDVSGILDRPLSRAMTATDSNFKEPIAIVIPGWSQRMLSRFHAHFHAACQGNGLALPEDLIGREFRRIS
jgi:hypothetical protein